MDCTYNDELLGVESFKSLVILGRTKETKSLMGYWLGGSSGHRVARGGVPCLGLEVVGEAAGCWGGVWFWGSVNVGLISVRVFFRGGSVVGSSGFFLFLRMGSFGVDCWGFGYGRGFTWFGNDILGKFGGGCQGC